jgi:hypothetical protein
MQSNVIQRGIQVKIINLWIFDIFDIFDRCGKGIALGIPCTIRPLTTGALEPPLPSSFDFRH